MIVRNGVAPVLIAVSVTPPRRSPPNPGTRRPPSAGSPRPSQDCEPHEHLRSRWISSRGGGGEAAIPHRAPRRSPTRARARFRTAGRLSAPVPRRSWNPLPRIASHRPQEYCPLPSVTASVPSGSSVRVFPAVLTFARAGPRTLGYRGSRAEAAILPSASISNTPATWTAYGLPRRVPESTRSVKTI